MPRLSGSGKSAAAPPQRSVSSAPNDAGGEHGHVNSDSGSGSGHSNSGNSDNRTAAPPHPAAAAAAAAAAASTEMRRQLERKRQRELADVDLVCAPAGAKATDAARRSSRGSRPPDEDDPGRREASSRSSRSSTSSSSNVAQTTTLPPPPPKKKKACANGSRTKTSPVVVPLAELEKPRRRRRLRRESDKMYEEWEKADGRYKVAFRRPAESDRHPAESGRGTAAAFNVRVLAVSNPKISRSAVPLFPGGPRVYVIAEPPRTGNRVGLLFLPCEQATAQQRVSDCALVFYVVSGKVRVNMALERCGGKRARFTVNKGGAWEVPCRTTYSIENSLSMTAQLFFWRWRAEDDEGTGDSHHLHMPTECGDRAARHA